MAETHKATSNIGSRLRLRGGKPSRPPTHVAALDLDGGVLRVAVGSRRGDGVEFTSVVETPLNLPDDADRSDAKVVGQAIGRALGALRLKPGTVAMAVPRREAILRTVSLPDLKDERELAAMVLLQVARDLPYRKEDAVIDFEVRPLAPAPEPDPSPSPAIGADAAGTETATPAAPKVEALVAVAQASVVSFYQQACEAAGLKLGALTFAPYAHAECLAACGAVENDATVAIIALRSTEVTVDVLRGDKLLFSRDAALAEDHHGEELAAASEPEADKAAEEKGESPEAPPTNGQLGIVDRATIEVVRSLHAFTGMAANAIAKIVVVGATGNEAAVADVLAARFSLPAVVLDPGVTLTVRDSDCAAALGGFSAMGVVIAATDPAGLPFNFLAPKRPPVVRDMRRIRMLAAAAGVAILLVGVFAVRAQLLKQRVAVQQQIQQEINNLAKNQTIYKRTRAQQAAIQEWVNEGRNWLDHYAYLTSVLPGSEEVYVTSLTIGSQGGIRLAVQARSGEVLAKLDKQLRDAGYEVKPQAITPGTDRHGYNFRSNFELTVPEKLEIDPAKIKAPPPRPADDSSLTSIPRLAPTITVYGGGQ